MSNKIKKAIISLSDKSDIKFILSALKKYKVHLISSGGTSKAIKNLGFKCTEVSEYTNTDEILDGRVKTLHPKLYAGILNKRENNSMNVGMKASNTAQKTLRNRRRIRLGHPALIQNTDKLVMNGLCTSQLVLDENKSVLAWRSREQCVKLRIVHIIGRNIGEVEGGKYKFEILNDNMMLVRTWSAYDVVRGRHGLNKRGNFANIIVNHGIYGISVLVVTT